MLSVDTEIGCSKELAVGDATQEVLAREFKVEAVRLIKDRGGSAAQAARDLDVHENVLRKWVKELATDPDKHFPETAR
jgi:transposase